MNREMCLVSLLVAVLGLLNTHFCNAVIILDSGNPPVRYIRGTYVDVNHPEYFGSSISEKQQNNYPIQDSVETLTENIVASLTSFNKEMVYAQRKEVEKADLASIVMVCRFSRTRICALTIKNIFEAQLTKVEIEHMETYSTNTMIKEMESAINETKYCFEQMTEDLKDYDDSTHGTEAMEHFRNALKNYYSLHMLASKE